MEGRPGLPPAAGPHRLDDSAEAKIEGDTVVVSNQNVPHPVHIRYKSHNSCPWANLFNKDRWPAFAFNTRWMQK